MRSETAGRENEDTCRGNRSRRLEETSEETEKVQEEEAKEEKKASRRKQKADKKQDARRRQIEELQDQVKRQMAEFDNFRKRTEKEKAAMFEIGAKSVIEKILPVVDNFERGLAAVPEEEKGTPSQKVWKRSTSSSMKTLEDRSKAIEAVGQEFDPNLHNAVMHVEDERVGENVIARSLQKGIRTAQRSKPQYGTGCK